MSLGSFKKMIHAGPILVLVFMQFVSLSCLHCMHMWWPLTESLAGLGHTLAFISWNGVILYNLFSAILVGPGYVPHNWKPDDPEDEQHLQYCKICKAFKAPRAHHCRRCQRCVLKMDHHCPWINNCCGHKNHANFIYFLVFTILAAIHASIILCCSIYRAVYRVYHLYNRVGPYVHLTVNALLVCIFSLGITVGAIIGLSALLFIQMRLIIKNQTGIESYIVSKANRPRPENDVFVFPYDLGCKENLKQLFCGVDPHDLDDGIDWPVKEGCHKYALTIEQIEQKEEKKRSVREYVIVAKYGGSLFPLMKGVRVACTTPCCTDEPRITVSVGDLVVVSRWKRHWLYGEIASTDVPEEKRIRGWFPRICAGERINCSESNPLILSESQKKDN